MTHFFQDYMYIIFFIYGLAFFLMGWTLLMKSPKKLNSFTRGLRFMAYFGIVHGAVEWMDMHRAVSGAALVPGGRIVFELLRCVMLGISFCFLLCGGIQLYAPRRMKVGVWGIFIWIGAIFSGIIFYTSREYEYGQYLQTLELYDIFTRYALATTSSILVSLGLMKYAGNIEYSFNSRIVSSIKGLAVCFALYAFFGGLVTPQSNVGLASVLNYSNFQSMTGIPVQAVRTLIALVSMFFSLRILDVFNYDEINRDSKTGLYNNSMIYKLMEGHIRKENPFSLLFIDIDYFKKINDVHSHLMGDEVLKRVADIFKSNIRSMDYAGRFGGEEYVVVLSQNRMQEALAVAERLRKNIEETAFLLDQKQNWMPLTVSIGVAEWKNGMTIDQLLERADEAMYCAKKVVAIALLAPILMMVS